MVGSLYFPPVQDNFQTFNPGLVGSINFQTVQDNFQTFNPGLVGRLYFQTVQGYLRLYIINQTYNENHTLPRSFHNATFPG